MANVTMEQVKELREKTQVGMMDCKKALIEANGNMEEAIKILRKKGAAVAAKRAENVMNHGRVESYIANDFSKGSLIEVCCETDFSANTNDMKQFALLAAQKAVEGSIDNAETLLSQAKEVKDTHEELLAKISEKIEIGQIATFVAQSNGIVNAYIHPGSTIGVLVEIAAQVDLKEYLDEMKVAARDICMHIAVTNPLSISPENLDQKIVEQERTIAREQLKQSGKPENIIDKILTGKMNKYYEEVCLMSQKFIKDNNVSITQYLKNIGDKHGNVFTVKRFARFSIGRK